MLSLISLNGSTVSVVSIPLTPGLESIDWSGTTAAATVTSVFTGQTQVQQWPGADLWMGTATLPPMTQAQANPWKAALLQLQGMTNAFQLGDPMGITPKGHVQGTPVVDGSIAVVAGGITLPTMGWTPSQSNLLMPGDYLQVGFRLHMVLDQVISDSSGKAVINIWPSLREVPLGGEAVGTNSPVGLFRLANSKVSWSTDATLLTHLSFQIKEYR
jgi:hypothetical protein